MEDDRDGSGSRGGRGLTDLVTLLVTWERTKLLLNYELFVYHGVVVVVVVVVGDK